MPRIPQLTQRDQVAPEHQAAYDAVAAARGAVTGPSSLLMHSPALAEANAHLTRYWVADSLLPARVQEVAILCAARAKGCGYVWASHVPTARKAGVPEAVIAAIANRGPLEGLEVADADLIAYLRQLLGENRVEQPQFDRMLARHGAPVLVEITALSGHYGNLAGLLLAFDVQPAAGAEVLPA